MRKKIGIFFLILIAYYAIFSIFHIAIPCPIYKITHFYCPGCGLTRMLFALIHLDIYQAFRYNPLVFILLIIFLLIRLYELIFHKKVVVNSKFTYALLVIVIIYGIMRNVPGWEFLKPTKI